MSVTFLSSVYGPEAWFSDVVEDYNVYCPPGSEPVVRLATFPTCGPGEGDNCFTGICGFGETNRVKCVVGR